MRHVLPEGSPLRFPAVLPRGPELWDPTDTAWTASNTDGLQACELIEALIRLTKGAQRGELVQLRAWQADFICDVLRLDEDLRRMYRAYLLLVARKNSKSLLGAGLAIDGLLDEPGAEVYSCAADKDQAKIVFGEVKTALQMVKEYEPELAKQFQVFRDVIEYVPTGSIYRALSSDSFRQEGLNPSRVIFDELHAQQNDELWNVMNQGSGTRAAPLVLAISTFGLRTYTDGMDSICYREWQRGQRVMSGEEVDPMSGFRFYETPQAADHKDEAVWPAANPALGDFLHHEDMQAQCVKMPENDFRTKRLNIWVAGTTAWLPFGAWDALATERQPPDPGTNIVLAFDGSYNNDSTALVACTLDETPHLWVVGVWEKRDSDDPAWVVPRPEVEARIHEAFSTWNVVEIACDRAGWDREIEEWQDRYGEDVVLVIPQSSQSMGPACSRLYTGVQMASLTHDGNPAMSRHLRNAVTKETANGAVIVKDRRNSPRKIDLAVGAVMAFERATFRRDDPPLSQQWMSAMQAKG